MLNRRFLFCCCCSFLLTGLVRGQFAELRYDAGGNESGRELLVLEDRIIVAGATDASVPDRSAGLFHILGLEGNLLHTRRMAPGPRSSFQAIAPAGGGQFILGAWANTRGTTDDLAFYRVDTSGTVLASWRYGEVEEDEQVQYLLRVGEDQYLALGNIGSTNLALAMLFDGEGNVAWSRSFELEEYNFNVFTGAIRQGDQLVLSGHAFENDGDSQLFYVRLTLEGDLVDYNSYEIPGEFGQGPRTILGLPGGNILLTTQYLSPTDNGNGLLLTLTREGEVVQANSLSSPGRDRINASILTEDGFPLFAGDIATERGQFGTMYKAGPQAGRNLRVGRLGINDRNRINALSPGKGGNILSAGTSFCEGPNAEMVLLQTNASLERSDSCGEAQESWRLGPATATRDTKPGILRQRPLPRTEAPPIIGGQASSRANNCAIFDVDADDVLPGSAVNLMQLPTLCVDDEGLLVGPRIDLGTTLPDSVEVVLLGSARAEIRYEREGGVDLVSGNDRLVLTLENDESLKTALRALRLTFPQGVSGEETGTGRFRAFYPCQPEIKQLFEYEIRRPPTALTQLDTVICGGAPVVLDAGRLFVNDYDWESPGGAAMGELLTVSEPGRYIVAASNECGVRRDTFQVTTAAEKLGLTTLNRPQFCAGDSAIVGVITPGATRYTWSDGVRLPIRFLRDAAPVEVVISNGCEEKRVSINPVVTDCCEVYLPSAFSPNGDGVNDRFVPLPAVETCGNLQPYELVIFNRWGGELFRTDDPGFGWDGRLNGESISGVVGYSLMYTTRLRTVRRSGVLTILR